MTKILILFVFLNGCPPYQKYNGIQYIYETKEFFCRSVYVYEYYTYNQMQIYTWTDFKIGRNKFFCAIFTVAGLCCCTVIQCILYNIVVICVINNCTVLS